MIKFIVRFIKHLAIWLCISLPLQALGIILLALYLPVSRGLSKAVTGPESVKLPYILRWFDNADIYIGRDYSTYLQIYAQGLFQQYYWLAIRNPCNYFGYKVLGVEVITKGSGSSTTTLADGDSAKIDRSSEIGDATNQFPGLRTSELEINGKTYYEYYYIKTYTFMGVLKCFRFRLGYKLGSLALIAPGEHIQQVFVISPYHSYNGVVS